MLTQPLPSGSGDQRRISPLEAAFSYANVPWATSGVTPLWSPGGEPHGNVWPGCCGFVILPESQNQWFIMRQSSFNVIPAATGLKPTDQTWHYSEGRSALSMSTLPCATAAHTRGAVLHRARVEKAAKYSELLEGGRCQLLVVGIETGGRWSSEAAEFVDMMAQAKAREAPQVLQRSVHLSWRRRWMRMLVNFTCSRVRDLCSLQCGRLERYRKHRTRFG